MKNKIPAKYKDLFYRMSNEQIINEIKTVIPAFIKIGVTSENARYARALRKEIEKRGIRF